MNRMGCTGVDRKELNPAAERVQSSACVRSAGDVGLEWNSSSPNPVSPFCCGPCHSYDSQL